MKKIYCILVLFLLTICCSCTLEKETCLKDFVERNGKLSASIYKSTLNISGEWSFYGKGKTTIKSDGQIIHFQDAVYLGPLMVGLEFVSEGAAKNALDIFNSNSYSYYQKDKYLFPTYLGSFVLFYGVNSFNGNDQKGYWFYDKAMDKKILLGIQKNHTLINNNLIIDGYDVLIHRCIALHQDNYYKKVVIGKDVDVLYYGALADKDFEIIEFKGDIEEIHGCQINSNETFKYTIIPLSVKYIGSKAFKKGNIYCEHESKPDAWDNEFITGTAKVYWAGEWEYNEEGVPVPLTLDN